MKKIIVTSLLSFVILSCSSSKTTTTQAIKKPLDVPSYINSITSEELKTHLYIVASDEMQGRNTGSEGQKKAGNYIIEQHKKNGIPFPKGADSYYQKVPSEYMKKGFSPKLPDSENIWVYIEGSEKPDEVVVVSAHYDHVGMKNGEIYNGADDDGSGTVGLIEIAQAFQKAKKEGHGPKRSVLILHVTGEEHGLHGSRFYSENPIFPLKNTVADVNIDMIGRQDDLHPNNNNYVYVIGSDYLSTDLYNICEEMNKKYTKMELDYKYNDKADKNRYYYRSDHYNFAKNGIPSVFFFNGTHADYHKPTDTVDKIDFIALKKRTQLAFITAWEIANRPNRLVVDKVDK
jgi:Zn-dependent M28 family amino/carboxypeptidase